MRTLCEAQLHHKGGVSPFGHPRIKACLAAPRGLSQLTTSFFGIFCQGIHYMPLNEILFFQRSNSEGKNSLLSICPTVRHRFLTSNYWIPSRQMADEILITCFEKFFISEDIHLKLHKYYCLSYICSLLLLIMPGGMINRVIFNC